MKGQIGTRTKIDKKHFWKPNPVKPNHIDSFGNPYFSPKKNSHKTKNQRRIKIAGGI